MFHVEHLARQGKGTVPIFPLRGRKRPDEILRTAGKGPDIFGSVRIVSNCPMNPRKRGAERPRTAERPGRLFHVKHAGGDGRTRGEQGTDGANEGGFFGRPSHFLLFYEKKV